MGITCPKGNKEGQKTSCDTMFNTQMPKDSLMLWIFDGDEISKNIGEYKTTIANEASKSTMLFYCRHEKD